MTNNIKIETEYYQSEDNNKFKIKTIEKKEKHNRNFKGVWIPKIIWINKKLSWMEKLFLVEIDSLDNKEGCYASNNYFAEFFQLSKQRCSQIINSLIKKKCLNVTYVYNNKEIKKRVLKIIDRYQENFIGYQENDKDINTINNILSKDNKIGFKKPINKNKLSCNNCSKITKYCLDTFYKYKKEQHPKSRKNTFYSEDKIYLCEKLINYFIKGFPKTNYNDLRKFIKDNGFKYNIDKGFILEEYFKEFFDKAIKIYDINYYPVNKEILPKHLKDFLYNSFMEFKSYFLKYVSNPVKKISIEKQRKDKYPKITDKYNLLLNNINSIDDKNKLISYIRNIVIEYEKVVNQKIEYKNKTYTRKDIENDSFITHVNTIIKFINMHIEYLESVKQYKEINFNYLFVGGKYWKDFIDWIKKNYEISFFELSDKALLKKCRLFFI